MKRPVLYLVNAFSLKMIPPFEGEKVLKIRRLALKEASFEFYLIMERG